jgi:hypothetical protein
MEFRLSRSLFTNFFFRTIKSRLSRSLLTILSFTRWNLGYQGAFSRIVLSHDGISAINKHFHELFFFQWNIGYQGAFHTHNGIHKMHDFGGDSFHMYHKSIYIVSTSLKTLPLDLEPPFCKEKSTVLLIVMKSPKRKQMFLILKSLIDSWLRFCFFRNVNLRKKKIL